MRSPSALFPPVLRCSLSLAAATSLTSSPYVKRRPESEWMTAVRWASCFLMASKMGRRGSVDAILMKFLVATGRVHLGSEAVVRDRRLRAHMATAAPRISAFDSRCKASDGGSCVGVQ